MTLPPIFIFLLAFLLPHLTSAAYTLKEDYTEKSYAEFFNKFTFWTTDDPTEGYVDYVGEDIAWQEGLIGNGGNIYMGVDHKYLAEGRGRMSVRLTSKVEYDSGMIVVADVTHMPSTCGTWPALWLTSSSPKWPEQGEIDVIEQANAAPNNQISIHVKDDCYINTEPHMTGNPQRFTNCAHDASGGCAINDPRDNSFGRKFNGIGGGVYAMEWTDSKISVWFWPRGEYTANKGSAEANATRPFGYSASEYHPFHSNPRPNEWGLPVAVYESSTSSTSGNSKGCDFKNAFKKQRIVINTTFCGAWGTESWEASGCKKQTGFETCEAYVRDKPSEMMDAWWGIRGLRVYTWNQ